MANIKIDSGILLATKQKVISEKENLVNSLDSIVAQLQSVDDIYKTNGGSQANIDSLVNTVKNLKNGYENRNFNFIRVLDESIAEYKQQDVAASSNISSIENGVAAAGAVGGTAGIAAGSLGAGKMKDVSAAITDSVQEQVKEVIATNGKKPITGQVIDSDDPLVKGLANMNGGEVVRMEDGRIAVRDETGSGVIFNKDGTTEAVTTKPTILASGERTSGNSNGRDPYTQEVAQVLHDEGYSDKQVDKFINSVDKKMDDGRLSEELSIDTSSLRDTFENGPGIERGPGVSAVPSESVTVEAPQPAATTAPASEAAPEPATTTVEGIHGGPGVTVEPGVSPTVEASQSTTSESPVVTPTQYVPAGDTTDDPTIW